MYMMKQGMKCDIWAARSIEEVFKGCGIDYPQNRKKES